MKDELVLSALGRRTHEPAISWLMAHALAHPKLISLAAGFTDNPSLPVAEARQLLDHLLRSPHTGQSALQYGTTLGEPKLRDLTAARLRTLDGAIPTAKTYAAERVVITSGSQQLLYMTTEALCNADDIVLVEDPTYFVYLGILQSHGVQARGIRLERDGIDVEHLRTVLLELKRQGLLPRVKLLYLVTYFQNPTGVTTSFAKKRAVLKLLKSFEHAAGHPIYLVEDAAYRELQFSGAAVKSALAIPGAAERVLFAGTYSKPFATGVRVGFGVLPEPVFSVVRRIKGNHDFGTTNLLQQLLTEALASRQYLKHLTALRRRYAVKAAVMRAALTKHFPKSVEWWEASGGLYFWARLPHHLSAGPKSHVFQAALEAEVLYVPGELCYAEDPTRPKPHHEMRLSFGGASEANIREGIKRLGAVLTEALEG